MACDFFILAASSDSQASKYFCEALPQVSRQPPALAYGATHLLRLVPLRVGAISLGQKRLGKLVRLLADPLELDIAGGERVDDLELQRVREGEVLPRIQVGCLEDFHEARLQRAATDQPRSAARSTAAASRTHLVCLWLVTRSSASLIACSLAFAAASLSFFEYSRSRLAACTEASARGPRRAGRGGRGLTLRESG